MHVRATWIVLGPAVSNVDTGAASYLVCTCFILLKCQDKLAYIQRASHISIKQPDPRNGKFMMLF